MRALAGQRVLASTEHRPVLELRPRTVVDIGANRGQFALAARHFLPDARIISFEPLAAPAATYRAVFQKDPRVTLHQVAIGARRELRQMNICAEDDASSLLPVSRQQEILYSGAEVVGHAEVSVCPLDDIVNASSLERPALLKIDVQGAEFDTLMGCRSLLGSFDFIYCECSFIELYHGQKLAAEIIAWLADKSFALGGAYNVDYDSRGRAIQADLLFRPADQSAPQ